MHQTAFFKAKTVMNYRFPRQKTRILHICRPNTKTQVCDYTKTKYRFKINVKLNQLCTGPTKQHQGEADLDMEIIINKT
ncbi:hypothetical protein CUMW_010000 [Citrus unshiu]|nr:hypothetical protein CUMW_010000 [Citrus unshiu]